MEWRRWWKSGGRDDNNGAIKTPSDGVTYISREALTTSKRIAVVFMLRKMSTNSIYYIYKKNEKS